MAEYIEREAVLSDELTYCLPYSVGKAAGRVVVFAEDIEAIPAADVAPVVHCKSCVYDKDCFIQKSLSIANIDNPYCCLGKRKARMEGE